MLGDWLWLAEARPAEGRTEGKAGRGVGCGGVALRGGACWGRGWPPPGWQVAGLSGQRTWETGPLQHLAGGQSPV